MRAVLAVFLGFCLAAEACPAFAQSPSFDCGKARLPDEIAICGSRPLSELDVLVSQGYDFLKATRGRPFADQIGIPFWRMRQACQADANCIARRQIESIQAYRAAGAPVSLPSWVEAAAAPAGETDVPVSQDGGTFVVPVGINGQITLKFVIDSGASDVSIPADVVMTLLRTGTIGDSDFLGKQTYRLADGSTAPSQIFNIRSLKVGDVVVENVRGSIAPVEGALLLGQSFLTRFHSWSIDNRRQVLVLR